MDNRLEPGTESGISSEPSSKRVDDCRVVIDSDDVEVGRSQQFRDQVSVGQSHDDSVTISELGFVDHRFDEL